MARGNTSRRSFLASIPGGLLLAAPQREAPVSCGPLADAIRVGARKQLFIDDYIIDSMQPGVYKLLNQPRKYQENPVIRLSTKWEHQGGFSHIGDGGKVYFDEEKQAFQFYGLMVNWDTSSRWLSYAESKDGIHGVKPELGQVKLFGQDTNLIALPFSEQGFTNTVLKDPAARRERERYKMLYQERRGGQWGLCPAHSSDGLQWTSYRAERPVVPFSSDTNNNLIWDARHKRYMLYLRTTTSLERWFRPEPIYPEGHRTRTAGWASSEDFRHWDAPQIKADPDERYICFHADGMDPVGSRDFYTLEVLPYEDGYVGFTSVYHNMFGLTPAAIDAGSAQSPWVDRMDVQLVWSREGKKFERVGYRRVFLPNGPEGSWDAELVYTVQAPIVREELGEIWIYYEGFGGHHWFNQRGEHQRGRWVWRSCGWMALSASPGGEP